MNRFAFVGVLSLMVLAVPTLAFAIPPPDVLANVGSQLGQIASLLAVGMSIGFGVFVQYFNKVRSRSRKEIFFGALVTLLLLTLALIVVYVVIEQNNRIAQEKYETEVAKTLHEGVLAATAPLDPPMAGGRDEIAGDLPLAISNEEFDVVNDGPIFVLDAREDEEYAIGNYPGSTHVRFADLLDGAWSQLPIDQVVYVLCWSGIRGSEVASFLRTKGVMAQFLEKGADGWVNAGGTWNGGIAFLSVYKDSRYSKTFETDDVRSMVADGAVLVDARSEASMVKTPLAGSVPASIIYTPSGEIDAMLAKVPAGSKVVVICDEYVNCFDAKIVGIRLENLGHTFLGRYAKPWEY